MLEHLWAADRSQCLATAAVPALVTIVIDFVSDLKSVQCQQPEKQVAKQRQSKDTYTVSFWRSSYGLMRRVCRADSPWELSKYVSGHTDRVAHTDGAYRWSIRMAHTDCSYRCIHTDGPYRWVCRFPKSNGSHHFLDQKRHIWLTEHGSRTSGSLGTPHSQASFVDMPARNCLCCVYHAQKTLTEFFFS